MQITWLQAKSKIWRSTTQKIDRKINMQNRPITPKICPIDYVIWWIPANSLALTFRNVEVKLSQNLYLFHRCRESFLTVWMLRKEAELRLLRARPQTPCSSLSEFHCLKQQAYFCSLPPFVRNRAKKQSNIPSTISGGGIPSLLPKNLWRRLITFLFWFADCNQIPILFSLSEKTGLLNCLAHK